ncbi:unnamed protein product [Spirodela intermedia]|uniref:Methyltransferase n=1 Tax=Spirodela intermedia TaxID=51605 RepID=A0A7I8ITI1_SPIIN|nr:unnamed protein product [Spirodela intermedia]CAA6660427.1 unnamed protein product [Spirodela intermedia]
MASGKGSRMDSRKSSSSYCSTVTLVVFVALCLVGVWMMTSSSVVPVDISSHDTQSDAQDQVSQTGKQFEESPGDISEQSVTEEKTEQDDTSFTDTNGEKEQGDPAKITEENPDATENTEQDQSDNESKSEKVGGENDETQVEKIEEEKETDDKEKTQTTVEVFPDGAQSELLKETNTQEGAWSTQAAESTKEKETQKSSSKDQFIGYDWRLCNASSGPDYIPCLDNLKALKKLRSNKHYEHRERHCPEEGPSCLVPLPDGYRQPIKWPQSRDKIWYFNVPHTKLAVVKGHQNWVKVTGNISRFRVVGLNSSMTLPDIAWAKKTRVILDVGCGVASFGGFLFDKDVLAMSFAPKDEHEAQVQFALERGIPAISAVMGTKRLPFPSNVFDVVHCARCRVPWHIEGGTLLLELNRLLRPGGYFVWSATPVYQKLPEDVEVWEATTKLTKAMCWEMVAISRDAVNSVGVAIFRKPTSNDCYDRRTENDPPLCQESDQPNAAWNVPLQACMHRVPADPVLRGSRWPQQWPKRLTAVPYWLNSSQIGHWKNVVDKSYLNGMGIDWSSVRNVMDMRSVYGGLAAALRDLKVWVMNVVSINGADTLPVIYERGLFGIYHDWCESFSSYPRTYDLLHADHLFSKLKKRCKLVPVIAEVDRLLRPDGKLIVRDNVETIGEVESLAKSLHWEVRMTYTKQNEGILCLQKTIWRPLEVESVRR